MFVMALLVCVPIFVTAEQCEEKINCQNWLVKRTVALYSVYWGKFKRPNLQIKTKSFFFITQSPCRILRKI